MKKTTGGAKKKALNAKKKALKAMSDYIRARDNWVCFTCGKLGDKYNIDAGHLFSRRYNSTLFDEYNVHAQCVYCNRYLYGNLHVYIKRFVKKYGQNKYDELEQKTQKIKKFCTKHYLKIEEYYLEKQRGL